MQREKIRKITEINENNANNTQDQETLKTYGKNIQDVTKGDLPCGGLHCLPHSPGGGCFPSLFPPLFP